MALEFLSYVQAASLSASYENIILMAKQVIYLESLYIEKKICSLSWQQDTKNLARFACEKPAFGKFAYSHDVQLNEKEKIMQKSGLHE